MWTAKSRSRRAEIRKCRPDTPRLDWDKWKQDGILSSLGIAVAFFVCAAAILMWRQEVIEYRPGQWIPHDIVARVRFAYFDSDKLDTEKLLARQTEPRIYRQNPDDVFEPVRRELMELPDAVGKDPKNLPADLKDIVDSGTVTQLLQYHDSPQQLAQYKANVDRFIEAVRLAPIVVEGRNWPLIVLPNSDRDDELRPRLRNIRVGTLGLLDPRFTFGARSKEFGKFLSSIIDRSPFPLALQPKIVEITLAKLNPNYLLDGDATQKAQDEAAALVPQSDAEVKVMANQPFITKARGHSVFDQQDWRKLKAENDYYIRSLKGSSWKSRFGTALLALIVTIVLSAYVASYQPKVVRNHARALGIAGLLLSMLLLAQLTGLNGGPLYLLGVAPTLLVAMILTIAYEQRFAVGLSSVHGILATVALQQGITFFIVIWIGVITACFLLGDIRSRSKIIEIGGAMALAMMLATLASGYMGFDPARFVLENALYAGAAGLAVGFIVLGILPFIEKAFRITTSMTLLELADVSQPLLRRLQIEAAGTYNHSLQVATLAEAAADAIGANSLLCRVGAYYHDIGKINKADYFAENQTGGENRHLNLNPSVSLLVIIGHVKDGVEMAREYNLPTSLVPFIQQHHGTTLVEYFYHQACKRDQQKEDGPGVSETQYRYPGPKPRSKEVAIVMVADAAESACRAMPEPTASRVESLVHELVMRRLLDGQFDECDVTICDLEKIERSIMKSLLAIYHGRIQYPSTAAITAPPTTAAVAGAAKSA